MFPHLLGIDHFQPIGKAVNIGNHQILCHGHSLRTAIIHTILRNISQSGLTDLTNRIMGHIFSLQINFSLTAPDSGCDNRDQFTLTVAIDSGNSQDLFILQGKRHTI